MSIYSINVSAVATGTSALTLLELTTTTTDRATIASWWCEFAGTSGSAAPILVQMGRITGTRTGGTSISPTANPYHDYDPAATVTVKNYSVEGTGHTFTALESHYVHPQSGIVMQYPLGREPTMAVSTLLGIRVTAAASVNAAAGFIWEE